MGLVFGILLAGGKEDARPGARSEEDASGAPSEPKGGGLAAEGNAGAPTAAGRAGAPGDAAGPVPGRPGVEAARDGEPET